MNSRLYNLLLAVLLLIPIGASADTSWKFNVTPSDDQTALAADANWTYNSTNKRYGLTTAVADAQLTANGRTLAMTAGLYFTASASPSGSIRVDVNKRLGLNGSDIIVRIPNLKAGTTVKVNFGSSSKGKSARWHLPISVRPHSQVLLTRVRTILRR